MMLLPGGQNRSGVCRRLAITGPCVAKMRMDRCHHAVDKLRDFKVHGRSA